MTQVILCAAYFCLISCVFKQKHSITRATCPSLLSCFTAILRPKTTIQYTTLLWFWKFSSIFIFSNRTSEHDDKNLPTPATPPKPTFLCQSKSALLCTTRLNPKLASFVLRYSWTAEKMNHNEKLLRTFHFIYFHSKHLSERTQNYLVFRSSANPNQCLSKCKSYQILWNAAAFPCRCCILQIF